jgi:hypothetical protein
MVVFSACIWLVDHWRVCIQPGGSIALNAFPFEISNGTRTLLIFVLLIILIFSCSLSVTRHCRFVPHLRLQTENSVPASFVFTLPLQGKKSGAFQEK